MKTFFDTNILVYAFDVGAPAKRKKAAQLLSEHAAAGEVLISTQVLQEFYVAVTRKLAQPLAEESALVATRELTAFPTVNVECQVHRFRRPTEADREQVRADRRPRIEIGVWGVDFAPAVGRFPAFLAHPKSTE